MHMSRRVLRICVYNVLYAGYGGLNRYPESYRYLIINIIKTQYFLIRHAMLYHYSLGTLFNNTLFTDATLKIAGTSITICFQK